MWAQTHIINAAKGNIQSNTLTHAHNHSPLNSSSILTKLTYAIVLVVAMFLIYISVFLNIMNLRTGSLKVHFYTGENS